MIIGKESEKLEFKKTTAELREGVISMAAILNKHGGGELYFGVLNDGTPAGQMVGADTLRDISQAVSNHIEPQIYPKISEVVIENKRCIHVEFSGEDPPYFAYGRVYVRVADEDKQMTPTELEAYFLRKSARRDTWDSELSGKMISHVDEDILKKYVQQANKAGRIDFAFINCRDTLSKLGVANDDALTNAACVTFVGMQLMEVQMAVFATKNKFTFLDIRRGSGNIRQLIEVAVKYVIDNTRWRVVLDGSIQRQEVPEVPISAVREAVTNSFCHRDYRSSQNNEVAIYSDRIVIYNPGRFPDGKTPEDFITGKDSSIKRNPNIAQLLYYSKDIESFGTGLQRLAAECSQANVRVEFERSDIGFAVVFYRPVNHINTDGNIADNGYVGIDNINVSENAANFGVKIGEFNSDANGDIYSDVYGDVYGDAIVKSKTEKIILTQMQKNPGITINRLSEILDITDRSVKRHLKALKQAGLIERVGSNKTGHWVVNLPENAAKSVGGQE